jgi:hypothetical protein
MGGRDFVSGNVVTKLPAVSFEYHGPDFTSPVNCTVPLEKGDGLVAAGGQAHRNIWADVTPWPLRGPSPFSRGTIARSR